MAACARPESRSGVQCSSCYSAGARNAHDDNPIRLSDHDVNTVHDLDIYHEYCPIKVTGSMANLGRVGGCHPVSIGLLLIFAVELGPGLRLGVT